MNIHINASGLFTKSGLLGQVGQGSVSTGSAFSDKTLGKSNKAFSMDGITTLQKTKAVSKKNMSPQVIARKIAQGKSVTKAEVEFLKENFPDVYRKAMSANRIREKLEEALKSAKSDTAKASAVAEASAQASFLALADTKDQDSETSTLSAGLYSDAIQAALQKFGSKKLNKELEEFLMNKELPIEEKLLQDDNINVDSEMTGV